MDDLKERLRDSRYCGQDFMRAEAADVIERLEAELSKARMDLITAGCEWQDLKEEDQRLEAVKEDHFRNAKRLAEQCANRDASISLLNDQSERLAKENESLRKALTGLLAGYDSLFPPEPWEQEGQVIAAARAALSEGQG